MKEKDQETMAGEKLEEKVEKKQVNSEKERIYENYNRKRLNEDEECSDEISKNR